MRLHQHTVSTAGRLQLHTGMINDEDEVPFVSVLQLGLCGSRLLTRVCRGENWQTVIPPVCCSFHPEDWWADFKGMDLLRSCGCLTCSSFQRERWRNFPSLLRFHLSICTASHARRGAFHMHLENTTSPLVLSRRRWAFVSRLWERFSFSLGDSPLSSRCCKPASLYADGRLCLAGIRVFGAYCCPQRWVCQGRMPSKSAGEHYISHYLRTIGHFLLAAGQRGWSLAAKLMERRAVWEGLASKRGKRFQNW